MAIAFEQIDQEMPYEMQEDIKRCLQPSDELHPEVWSSSRFSDTQVHEDKGVEDIKQSVSHTQSEAETLRYLADTTCLRSLELGLSSAFKTPGSESFYYMVEWSQAKSRANRIMEFAQAVLESCESEVCENLIRTEHENIGGGVELKLRALLSFDDIDGGTTSRETKAALHLPRHDFGESFSSYLSRRSDKINLSNKEVITKIH